MGTIGSALWLGWVGAALGGPLQVAVEDEALLPGRASIVELAIEGAGAPSEWTVGVQGGKHEVVGARGPVARVLLRPDEGIDAVVLSVKAPEGVFEATVPVQPEPSPTLRVLPASGYVDGEPVRLRVRGDVEPRQVQVVLGEGRVLVVEPVEGGVDVVVEPARDPYAREIPFGIRDLRSQGSPPAWGVITLRARPVVPVRTAPGTKVTLTLGRRTYGPVVVPASGEVQLSVVQEPDDRVARLTIETPDGDVTRRSYPLSSGRSPPVLAFVDGAWLAGAPAPSVWLRLPVEEADAGVACQGPAIPASEAIPVGEPGVRRVVLPLRPPADAWEIRMRCVSSRGSEVTFAVPAAEGIPSGLRVRVWPEVLSADLPVADVAVTLENALGERVESRGRVDIRARHGEVVPVQRAGAGLRAEYRGHVVSEVGEDVLTVAWYSPPGEAPVSGLSVASAGQDGDGVARVHVRALDALQRPVPEVVLGVGPLGEAPSAEAVSDETGWATFPLPASEGAVRRIRLWAEGRPRGEALVVTDMADPGGPGAPDLLARVPVQVDPGRVAEVALDVDEEAAIPGARRGVAVTARFLDRNGLPARDPRPTLIAEEGSVGPAEVKEDGTVSWTWRPAPGLRPRRVSLVARSESLDLEDEVEVRVAPREVWRWVGVGFGVHTNFGRITSPRTLLELGWRLRFGAQERRGGGEPGLVIGGAVSWYGVSTTVGVLSQEDGLLKMNLVPITLHLAYRHSWPLHAVWLGGGLVVAPWVGSSRVGGVLTARESGLLTPGIEGSIGYAARVPGGELGLKIGVSSLTSPGSPASLRGWVGGVAAGVVYRVAY